MAQTQTAMTDLKEFGRWLWKARIAIVTSIALGFFLLRSELSDAL